MKAARVKVSKIDNQRLLKSPQSCEEVAELFRLLGHPQRLQLVTLLLNGEKSVGDLVVATGMSQSLVSQTLTKLKIADLVSCRRDGQHSYYSLSCERLSDLLASLGEIYCSKK